MPTDGLRLHRNGFGAEPRERGSDGVEIGSGVEQRAEQHVSGGTVCGVNPERDAHAGRLSIRATAAAAPNPLSMLTTVTPGAQALSMVSRAAIPPNDAP